MALILEGFERFAEGAVAAKPLASRAYDATGWCFAGPSTPASASLEISSTYGRTRGRGVRVKQLANQSYPPAAIFNYPNGAAKTKIIVGHAVKFSNLAALSGGSAWNVVTHAQPSGSPTAGISVKPYVISSGKFGLDVFYNDAAWSRLGGVSMDADVFYYLEYVVDLTARKITILLDSVAILEDATLSVATAGYFTTSFAEFAFRTLPSASPHDYMIDDFYYRDDVGESAAIEPFGPCKVDTVVPNATEVGEFTPNTAVAANYESVAELPDDPNTWNAAKVLGKKDLHTYSGQFGMLAADDVIKGVTATTVVTSDGPVSVDAAAGVGSSVSGQGAATVNGSPVGMRQSMLVNPATGLPFTPADLNDLKTGYSVGSWPST